MNNLSNKEMLDKLIEKYDFINGYWKTKEKWNFVDSMVSITNIYYENMKYQYHDKSIIDDIRNWNGTTKNLIGFNPDKKELSLLKSDYYTTITLKKELKNNLNHPVRSMVLGKEEYKFGLGLGVLNVTILDMHDEVKFIYHKRSKDVGFNKGLLSTIPSGGVSENHTQLTDCTSEEIFEELLDENSEVMNDLTYTNFYTGLCINVLGCNPNITGVIYFDEENSKKFLDNMVSSKETENIFIESFEEEFINDKFNVNNTSHGALYSLKRAQDSLQQIRNHF